MTNKHLKICISDENLYKLCQQYGVNAKAWLKKFAGLLPEVYKRRLYKKKNFISIHEFAKKLSGMNERTVDKILNLALKLQDKPVLLSQLQSGEQGWSKIEKVASIATTDTDKMWAEKVEKLPKKTLELYVREVRAKEQTETKFTPGSQVENIQTIRQTFALENNESESLFPKQTPQPIYKNLSFPVSSEVEHKLRNYKQKLEKKKKERLSWNQTLEELLKEEKNRPPGHARHRLRTGHGRRTHRDLTSPIRRQTVSAYG